MLRNLIAVFLFFINTVYANSFDSFTDHNKAQIPAEQAFRVNAVLESPTAIKISFNIMPDFYIYKDRLSIKSDNQQVFNQGDIHLPSGFKMNVFTGESYAEEMVLNGSFDVKIALNHPVDMLKLTVHLQGCDGKTICYPPQNYKFEFVNNSMLFAHLKELFLEIYSGGDNGILANPFELFLVFFLAGVAISLTPCMYPLYPIALSAISQTAAKKSSIIKQSLCYIHGISLVYVLMGIIAAFSGHLLITLIQTPVFVLISSAIFLLLGLAMFDLLEIKLPNWLHNYIHTKSANLGGGYLSAFIFGVLSSFLLGPCVTPPLIIAIGFIAGSGSILKGILGLYAISLGMGLPILILSTVGNKLLPKSGAWMNGIKHILGLIIIALAIYLAYPIINLANSLLSIGVLCFVTALAFLLLKQFRLADLDLLIHRIMPILMIIIGLIFTVLGSYQQTAIYMPSAGREISGNNDITSISSLDQIIAASNKPVIIIVGAKWCAICRELDATTFKDKNLQEKFKQYTVIHFDITDNQPDSKLLLRKYNLYGPPAIIILNKDNKPDTIITGYISAGDLMQRLII